MSDELARIREQIRVLTGEILRLAAKRNELAVEAAKIKRTLGLDIVDRSTEANLMREAAKLSRELGLDRDFAVRLVSLLVSGSVKAQEELEKSADVGLREIFFRALELQRSGRSIIRMEVGEPDFTAPPEVIEEACRSLREGKAKYLSSYGLAELRDAVAEKVNSLFGTDFRRENVLITGGGIMAIRIAIEVLTDLGDEVLVPEPAWPLYSQIAEQLGRRYVGLKTEMERGWALEPEMLRRSITDASRVLVINYPNNPTGRALSLAELKGLAEEARERGLTVISDEVYSDYYFHGPRAPSIAQVLDEGYVLVNSFSKMWGMTGYRVGYMVGEKWFIEKASKILGLMITCIPEFVQRAALKALENEEYVRMRVEESRRRVEFAARKLSRSAHVDLRPPDGTFYLFPRVRIPGFDSSSFALRLLEERGVAVAPGSGFGGYREHIRISAVKPVDELDRGIEILLGALEELARAR